MCAPYALAFNYRVDPSAEHNSVLIFVGASATDNEKITSVGPIAQQRLAVRKFGNENHLLTSTRTDLSDRVVVPEAEIRRAIGLAQSICAIELESTGIGIAIALPATNVGTRFEHDGGELAQSRVRADTHHIESSAVAAILQGHF
jgi:hypothetical protein